MVEKEIKRYLDDVKEENGAFVISHVVEIERVTEQRISSDDLVNTINVLQNQIEQKTNTYDNLAVEIENLVTEYDILKEAGVRAGVVEDESDSEEDSDDSEEESNDEE